MTPASAATDATGAVSFAADLSGGQLTVPVTVTETVQSGFTPFPINGQTAECTADGVPVAVTSPTANSFVVDAARDSIVICTVYNIADLPPASVLVNKIWNIEGVDYPDPTQPGSFQAQLSLTGQVLPAWGAEFTGYTTGDSVTIGETVNQNLLPPGCTITPSGDLGAQTLVAGLNTFEVRNTAVCVTTLTLLKTPLNPFGTPASPDLWTLTAYNPDGSALFSGVSGVSSAVTPRVRYLLGESTVTGYEQQIVPNAVIVPPSTGSWHCANRLRDGTLGTEFDGLNGGVTVQLGQNAECFAINTGQATILTLVQVVDNTGGGTAVPEDFLLHADPIAQPLLNILGRSGQIEVTAVLIEPGLAVRAGLDRWSAALCSGRGTRLHADWDRHRARDAR